MIRPRSLFALPAARSVSRGKCLNVLLVDTGSGADASDYNVFASRWVAVVVKV